MGRKEKPPGKGDQILSTWCVDVDRAANEKGGQRGNTREIAGVGGTRKPLQPFLALVTSDFDAPASAGADDASSGYAISLFRDETSGDYDKQDGEEFECFSHHHLPLDGDRIWVTWNDQSGRFEFLAGHQGGIITFRFIDFFNESELQANATVIGSEDGRLIGQTVIVVDASDEGCYFGDETEAELTDRTGEAYLQQYELGSGRAARFKVIDLCCPPGS